MNQELMEQLPPQSAPAEAQVEEESCTVADEIAEMEFVRTDVGASAPEVQETGVEVERSAGIFTAELVRNHYEELLRQERELKREFPGFSLQEALKDADFVRLTAPRTGVSLRRAYYAMHREEMDALAASRAAAAYAKAISRSAAMPREGGRAGAATIAADYRSMSRAQQEGLKKRIRDAAARGEKIYP